MQREKKSTEIERSGASPHPFLYGKFFSMLWALGQPGITHSERCVLVALASRIDNFGLCFPGLDRIGADIGGADRKTVSRALKALERKGLIAVIYRTKGGPKRTNTYRVGGNGASC